MSTLKEKAEQILQEKEEKIIAENIKKDVTIYNVTGSLQEGIDTSDATATDQDILSGKTAYVNGEKIVGYIDCPPNIMNYYPINYDYITITDESFLGETQWLTVDPIAVGRSTGNSIHQYITTDNNFYWKEMLGFKAVANVIGLTPEKIKKDETILGVTGTYEGEQSSGIRKLDLDVSEQDVYIQDWPQEGDVVCSISLPEGIEETDLNNGEYTLDFIMKDAPYEAEWVRLDGLNLVIGNNIEMGIDLMIGIRLTQNWEGSPALGYKEVRISFSA